MFSIYTINSEIRAIVFVRERERERDRILTWVGLKIKYIASFVI